MTGMYSFNEATALVPWKLMDGAHVILQCRGFNEATALVPWK